MAEPQVEVNKGRGLATSEEERSRLWKVEEDVCPNRDHLIVSRVPATSAHVSE